MYHFCCSCLKRRNFRLPSIMLVTLKQPNGEPRIECQCHHCHTICVSSHRKFPCDYSGFHFSEYNVYIYSLTWQILVYVLYLQKELEKSRICFLHDHWHFKLSCLYTLFGIKVSRIVLSSFIYIYLQNFFIKISSVLYSCIYIYLQNCFIRISPHSSEKM